LSEKSSPLPHAPFPDELSALRADRLQEVIDSIPAPVFFKDREGVYRGCNEAFCTFVGFAREQILGQTVFAVAPADLAEIYHRADLDLMEQGGVQVYEAKVRFADGSERDVMFHKAVMRTSADEVEGLVGVMLDITARKRLEDQVLAISRGVSGVAGEGFFPSLVEHLAAALGADIALVGMRKSGDPTQVCTCAVWVDGAPGEDFCYPLKGTPCEQANLYGLCSYPERVRQQFPDDPFLAEMQVEAYLAAPLVDSSGDILGVLAVLFRQALDEPGHIEALLKIFASRASAELELIRSDEALHDSERRLRAIFENTFEMAGLLAPDGRVLGANRTSLDLVGVQESEVLGRYFWETPWWRHSESEAARVRAAVEHAAGGSPVIMQTSHVDRHGKLRHIEFSVKPVHEGDRVLYLVPEGHDITEFKQVESALRESEARFRSIYDTTPDAMLLVQPAEGVIIGVNQGFCAITGYARADVVGRTSLELQLWVDEDDRARFYQQMERDGVVNNLEAEFRMHDGSLRFGLLSARLIQISGEPLMLLVVRDVNDLKATEMALRQSEDRYQAFIANSTEGIFRADLEPAMPLDLPFDEQVEFIIEHVKVSECNQQFAKLYGFETAEQMHGRYSLEFYDPDSIREVVIAFIEGGFRVGERETRQYDREGREIWLETSLVGTVEGDRLVRIWGTRRNVTERRHQLETLEYMANHDSLTGLPNRFWLKRTMEAALERRLQDGDRLALLLIDLDRFKDVNDSLGHHAGDVLLKQLGLRLSEYLKPQRCHLVRLGGDEFAVLLPLFSEPRRPHKLASELLRLIKLPFELDGLHVEVGASIGISCFPEHGNSTATLLRCSDVAMYEAKKDVRGYRLYDAASDPNSPERLALLSELGHAIRSGQMVLHYQPKVDLRRETLVGFEALVRWQHPVRGLIPPAEFVPYAELGSLIVPLTRAVLEQALAQWRSWTDAGFDTTMAVNISPRMLMDEELVQTVEGLVQNYRVPPGSLEFEFTETALFHDPVHAEEVMSRFHAMGIRLSVDDFGTGYSSLSLLRRLPLQTLKVDRSFVGQMVSNDVDMNLVSSTVTLAHNLGLQVVAEGVENAETLDALAEIDCDEAQGFFVARPMPAGEVEVWLARSRWSRR